MDLPETRYARLGDDHIAYQVIGSGSVDILYLGAWFSHVEMRWELPMMAGILRRLATFSRVIVFDKRGTGLSDPVSLTALPTLEEWMDDARVVMDAAGSDRAALFASFNSGPMALLFAATYPERTSALILANAYARFLRAPDYPWGAPPHVVDTYVDRTKKNWGTGMLTAGASPEVFSDEESRALGGRFERQSASPRAAAAMTRMTLEVDVRDILPTIASPTLVIDNSDHPLIRSGHGQYLAERIPNARYFEVPGGEGFFFGSDQREPVIAEIEEFLTGVRPEAHHDRVLATVLFTDLVGSTERAAELGDRAWKELLARHNNIVRRELQNHRGREISTAGDGFLATFDGPARAIHCAQAIADRLRALDLAVRAGLHTGEIELIGDDVGGIAVHIAARVSSLARPGEVLVSSTVKELVAGSGIRFVERGAHALKGVPDEWRLFAVEA